MEGRWTNGWKDGRKEGWVAGRKGLDGKKKDRWADGISEGRTEGREKGRMTGRSEDIIIEGSMERRKDARTNGGTDKRAKGRREECMNSPSSRGILIIAS